MEFDSQLLQNLLDFLRTLEGVSLPAKLENLRGRLLGRVQRAVSVASNYMDMQPGKPLKPDKFVPDDTSEEYVPADHQPQSPTSFLYHFENKKSDNVDAKQPRVPPVRLPPKPSILESPDPLPALPSSRQRVIQLPIIAPEEDSEVFEVVEDADPVLEIYNQLSLVKAEAKSHYFGKLQRREKWFVFENIRPFWAALVGHYLLTYDNRTDQKPTQILSIKGCTCKPVDTSQRNIKKLAESTFEICFEDDRCYQFIASTPKEMEQWVAMIVRWESKAHDTNNLHVPPPVPHISEEEPALDNSNSEDYYDDLVIHNIAEVLATPAKTPKINVSRSPVGVKKEAKSIPEIKANHTSPTHPQVFNRVLPPPPSTTRNSEQEDDVYHVIDDHDKSCTSISPSNTIGQNDSSPSIQNEQGAPEEFYDDIETMREEVKQLEANKSKKVMERNSPAREIADDDQATYDDVGVVKREVEQLRRNASTAKESAEVEKEKKIVPQPAIPARPSPMKNFFGRFRHKSESPEKEGGKKKTSVSSPQQLVKTQTPMDSRNPAETGGGLDSNPGNSDLSNYNSLPHPRPVKSEKSFPNEVADEDGECIYDDISNKRDGYNSHIVNLKSALEKRKQNDNLVHETSTKAQRNVACNLNERFEDEIYQNQSGVGNLEDELEHYQVPRADAKLAQTLNSLEDDDAEKIYDDVEIVAQKKREIEQSKQKPIVKTPPKFTRGPAVMAKPSANKLFNKLNVFPLSVSDKSSSEKNNQHRLIAGKKPKTQEANIPMKKRQLMAADEELYDDCLAK